VEEAAGTDEHLQNKSHLCMQIYRLFSFLFAFSKRSKEGGRRNVKREERKSGKSASPHGDRIWS